MKQSGDQGFDTVMTKNSDIARIRTESDDIDVAWDAAISKIDLDNPANSRFVLRLRQESHNCWTNCPTINLTSS